MATKRPDGLSPITSEVLDVLEHYTMFPWALLKTHAERVLLDPANLDVDALDLVTDDICKALARITSDDKANKAREELNALAPTLRTRP